MPCVKKQKTCHISPPRAFEIVKDFEKYPQFLPWCAAARLQESKQLDSHTEQFIADLVIKYTVFQEVFTTQVACHSDRLSIEIKYLKGPFKYLSSHWQFTPTPSNPNITQIDFMIDFELKFSPLQKIVSLFFEEAMHKMIDAFDARFKALS